MAIYQRRQSAGSRDGVKTSLLDMLQPSRNAKCGYTSVDSTGEIKVLNAIM